MGRNETSAAWAWVLSRASEIRKISNSVARKWSGMDADDFHQTVLVQVVERFHRLDTKRSDGEMLTWVRWQARAALTAHRKAERRRKRESEAVNVSAWDPRSNLDAARAIEARVSIRQIHRIATPDEWDAAVAKADGLKGSELSNVLGCAPFSASRRVRRLANRIA